MEEKSKDIIEVLHEKDLQEFLIELNKFEDFQNGMILCKFCKEKISKENIYGIFLVSGKSEFICDKKLCHEKYLLSHKGEYYE